MFSVPYVFDIPRPWPSTSCRAAPATSDVHCSTTCSLGAVSPSVFPSGFTDSTLLTTGVDYACSSAGSATFSAQLLSLEVSSPCSEQLAQLFLVARNGRSGYRMPFCAISLLMTELTYRTCYRNQFSYNINRKLLRVLSLRHT